MSLPSGPDLERIRREAEAFVRAASEEEYENLAGLKAASQLEAIYDRYAGLADRGLVAEVGHTTDAGPLAEFLVGHYAGRATATLRDRLLTAEAAAPLDLPGERVTYRNAAVAIRNEADRARRDRLAQARDAVDRHLTPLRAELWARTYEALAEVGHSDYTGTCAAFSGIDYRALAGRLERFTRTTDDVYRDHLGYFLRKWVPDAPVAGARHHDLARLLRAPEFDRLFPSAELVPAAERTAAGMGVSLTAEGRITIDAEAREGKRARAFCMPIEVPARVILVVMPQGGQDDYRAFLHELGHALHFAYTDPRLPFEARGLGDNSVTEGYAFTVEHLVRSRPWLKRYAGLSGAPVDDVLRFAHFEQLYFLRRYGAKLAYELVLHAGGGAAAVPGGAAARDRAEAYRAMLQQVLLVEYPPEQYLADVDPGFYSARYLRAWMFEAQLREQLFERFDEDWFRNPRAGAFFRELWAQGQPARLETLAAAVGLPAPDLAPLERELLAALA
jgi:hypothetical protein